MKRSILFLGLAGLLAVPAAAETMVGLTTDRNIVRDSKYNSTATYNDGNWYIRAGLGAATIHRAAEFVFQLPTVNDPNLEFTSADLRLQLLSKTGATSSTAGSNPSPTFNLDLYAVRVSADSAVANGDFYTGDRDATAILIQDNFIAPNSPIRVSGNPNYATTDAAADVKLVAFLNEAYAKGANAGRYVFLRMSPDYTTVTPEMANMNYTLVAAEAAGATERPTITYTVATKAPPAAAR